MTAPLSSAQLAAARAEAAVRREEALARRKVILTHNRAIKRATDPAEKAQAQAALDAQMKQWHEEDMADLREFEAKLAARQA
jgi:hypothetical protein